MESRVGVTETLLTSTQSSEVLSSLWDNIVVQLEGDSSELRAVGRDVEVNLGHDCSMCAKDNYSVWGKYGPGHMGLYIPFFNANRWWNWIEGIMTKPPLVCSPPFKTSVGVQVDWWLLVSFNYEVG